MGGKVVADEMYVANDIVRASSLLFLGLEGIFQCMNSKLVLTEATHVDLRNSPQSILGRVSYPRRTDNGMCFFFFDLVRLGIGYLEFENKTLLRLREKLTLKPFNEISRCF